MKSKIGDKDVLHLLTKIKDADRKYPQDLIASRRDMFTKQAAAMAVLMRAGINGTNGGGASAASTTSSGASTSIAAISVGKLLEALLVFALIAEAGVATYIYREKIAEFFNSIFGPKVEQVSSPINNSSEITVSVEPTVSEIPDETATAAETPPPPGYTPPAQSNDNNNNGSGNTQVESTPDPKNGNGLHLGKTKQASKEPKKDNDSKDKSKDK